MSKNKTTFEPTQAQKNAINAQGGGIIVSAAAGSGKTRVLVQRVIKLLTGENPVSADRLLILTFTNTAATEMKMRISQAIDELIQENPANDFYRKQQLLLSCADICTIDSFCSKIVRENFFRLGVSRDFRVGTSAELYELSRRIMSDIIEEYYTPPEESSENYKEELERYESFNIMSMLMTDAKLDNDLESELLEAYNKYTAHAFPDQWLKMCIEQYNPGMKLSENKAADYLFHSLEAKITKLRDIYDNAMKYYEAVDKNRNSGKKSYTNTLDVFDSCGAFLDSIERLYSSKENDYSGLSEIVMNFSKTTIRTGSSKDEDLKAAASELNLFGKYTEEELKPYACFTEEIFRENNTKLYPVMKCLGGLLQKFDSKYFEAKKERKILDFHDLESLVLRLLYRYDEKTDEYITTDFADEIRQKYEEIMIDEYQDTNDIQENIFRAISRDEENLFVVGDVKQSIFRFREAKPILFKNRCRQSSVYNNENADFPALIVLDKNFRSREGIIDSVNFIFGLLMSEKSGEIEYDENHRLTAGAYYPEKSQPDVELHIVEHREKIISEESDSRNSDKNSDDDGINAEEENKTKTEAIYCAGLIKDIIDRGDTVYDAKEKKERKAVFSDFCILMRSVRNTAHIYSSEFEKCGIPVYTDADFDLLERYEVKAALSYLKVLNNPLSDIDMIAALMCPVFGFTPDELSQIKGVYGKNYYKKLRILSYDDTKSDEENHSDNIAGDADKDRTYAGIGNELREKCRNFLETMRKFRELSVTVTTDRLLQEFFESTGFISVMNAMPNGEFRVQNLRRFMNFVLEYENSVSGGLTGFVRHVRYLEETNNGIRVSDSTPVNAVRIMTIHHSKGLEFPICIVAGMNTKEKVDASKVKYHSELGIGLRTIDTEKLLQFNTLQFKAIHTAKGAEEKSELLRLLYVALTRPKERLIMLSTVTTKENTDEVGSEGYYKYIGSLAGKIKYNEKTGHIFPSVVMEQHTLSDWVVMCALLNGEMTQLRDDACSGAGNDIHLPSLRCNAHWKFVHADKVERRAERIRTSALTGTDDRLEKFLRERFSEKRNDISTKIPSKVSASMLAHSGSQTYYAAVSSPTFAKSGSVSPAERGTATHAFLQYANINNLYKEICETGAFEKEKKSVTEQKLMSAEQASLIIDENIIKFSKSRLFERMAGAEKLYREYRFTVSIPARLALIDGESFSDEEFGDSKSILQGSIDCIIEEDDGIVIVDYKTDRVKDTERLKEMYGVQLRLYKEAANQIFDKPVKECYIYSLHCGCEIPIE